MDTDKGDEALEEKGEEKKLTLSEEELQGRVVAAVEARERELAEQHKTALDRAERERLRAEGNYRVLAEKFQGDLEAERKARAASELRGETAELLAREGMTALAGLFEKDWGSMAGRAEAVALVKAEMGRVFAGLVEAEVKRRLGSNNLPAEAEFGGRRSFRRPGEGDVSALYPTMKRG